MTTTNHRIWPGPERLRTRAHRLEKLAAEHGPFGALTRLGFLERVERAEFDRRSLGIAMCRAKARARMERFVAWLKDDGRHSSARSTAGFLSPEAWMETQASSVHTWFRARLTALNVAPRWAGRFYGAHYTPKRASALAVALLRSPEWLSLPWQRDPSEVSRG